MVIGECRICQSGRMRLNVHAYCTVSPVILIALKLDQLKQTLRWSGESRPLLRYYGIVCIYERLDI